MFYRALLAFLILPGSFGMTIPYAIGVFDPWRGARMPWGMALVAAGLVGLVWCVRDFYVAGKGTLAPWSPPTRLVVVGLYRHVRNPMYVAVLTLVAGLAVWFASPLAAAYAVLLALAFHLRVTLYEEHELERLFGDDWATYRERVHRWAPKFGPWREHD